MRERWAWVGLAVLAAIWTAVKLPLSLATQADENIYYYAASLISEGTLPYRDFFFAHPPLQELILALVFRVFGFSIIAGRMLPLLCGLSTILLVFVLVRERVGDPAALLAVGLGSFSFGFLSQSTYAHGVGLALALVLAATLAAERKSPAASGVLLALALSTRFLVAPAALALLVLVALREPRHGRRAALAAAAAFLGVNLIMILWAGAAYVTPVFTYHLAKTSAAGDLSRLLDTLWRQNYYLLLVALVAAVVPIVRRAASWRQSVGSLAALRDAVRGPDFLLLLAATTIVAHLIWLFLLHRVFGHYVLPLFPYLTLLAAWSFRFAGDRLAGLRGREKALRWSALAGAAVLALLVLLRPMTPGPAEGPVAHAWQGHRFGPLGEAVRAVFHREVEERTAAYCPITRFSWNAQKHAFGLAPAIAAWIAERTTATETLIGDSMQAPLIALLAERHIVANLVDLNPMRFEAGSPDVPTLLRTIDTPDLRYALLYPDASSGDLYRFAEVRALLEEQFTLERWFGPFALYRRLDQ